MAQDKTDVKHKPSQFWGSTLGLRNTGDDLLIFLREGHLSIFLLNMKLEHLCDLFIYPRMPLSPQSGMPMHYALSHKNAGFNSSQLSKTVGTGEYLEIDRGGEPKNLGLLRGLWPNALPP